MLNQMDELTKCVPQECERTTLGRRLALTCILVASLMCSGIALPCKDPITHDARFRQEALALIMVDAVIPYNLIRSYLPRLLRTFAETKIFMFSPTLRPQFVGVGVMKNKSAFDSNHFHQGPDATSLPEHASSGWRMLFAVRRTEASGKTEKQDFDLYLRRLVQDFLSDPDRSDQLGRQISEILEEQTQAKNPVARGLLAKQIARLRGSIRSLITRLAKGEGGVVKLPLRLENLKLIINSPRERALLVFRTEKAAYLLVYPGTSPDQDGAAMTKYYFGGLAHTSGHSHPRFTDSEFSEPDEQCPKVYRDIDHFVVDLVDEETFEVSLWRSRSTHYQTQRGPEAIKLLIELGLIAVDATEHTHTSDPRIRRAA